MSFSLLLVGACILGGGERADPIPLTPSHHSKQAFKAARTSQNIPDSQHKKAETTKVPRKPVFSWATAAGKAGGWCCHKITGVSSMRVGQADQAAAAAVLVLLPQASMNTRPALTTCPRLSR